MGIFSCPDCGGTVSTNANMCPHCGRPAKFKEERKEPEKTPEEIQREKDQYWAKKTIKSWVSLCDGFGCLIMLAAMFFIIAIPLRAITSDGIPPMFYYLVIPALFTGIILLIVGHQLHINHRHACKRLKDQETSEEENGKEEHES